MRVRASLLVSDGDALFVGRYLAEWNSAGDGGRKPPFLTCSAPSLLITLEE